MIYSFLFLLILIYYSLATFFNGHLPVATDIDDPSDEQSIITYATSGMISTPSFGKNITKDNFDLNQIYQVDIITPYYSKGYAEDRYHIIYDKHYDIAIEYDVEEKFECIHLDTDDSDCLNKTGNSFKTNLDILLGNKTYNFGKKSIRFKRNFQSRNEFKKWKKKRITGFKVQWNCTNCFTTGIDPSLTFKRKAENVLFVKLANLLNKTSLSIELIWNILKTTKSDLQSEIGEVGVRSWGINRYFGSSIKKMTMLEHFFEILLQNLPITLEGNFDMVVDDISDDKLETAFKMFIYVTAPYQKYWSLISEIYSEWLFNLSPRRILGRFHNKS